MYYTIHEGQRKEYGKALPRNAYALGGYQTPELKGHLYIQQIGCLCPLQSDEGEPTNYPEQAGKTWNGQEWHD